MKRAVLIAALLLVAPAPAHADSIWVDSPDSNLTGFNRPELGVGNIVTITVTENTTAETDASTTRNKDSRLRGDWNFGNLIPTLVASNLDLRGRDDFTGQGTTKRNGQLTFDISARIEQVLPNGTLRIVGTKQIRVNEEETEITVSGIIRPLDLTPDNHIDSSRIADAQIDVKGTGPVSSKAAPGLLTRLFNWLF